MSRKSLIVTIGGTVASALGIGYFMQQGESAPQAMMIPEPASIQQTIIQPSGAIEGDDFGMLEFSEITLTSALPDASVPKRMSQPSLEDTGLGDARIRNQAVPAAPADPTAPELGCSVTALASPGVMASVDLSVSAPCFGNERVTVHHNGMLFTDVTDADGQLAVTVPALAERAVFVVSLTNGKGAVAMVDVPSLSDFDRVAVQWAGNSGFQIHAREFGAGYGEPGHIWSGATSTGPVNDSGVLTRLGDADTLAPQLVEVYSFPRGSAARSGTVALSVEAEVTEANCGRDIAAQSLELRGGATLRTRDLLLAVPDCTAKGDFLVLNNLVDDLKIAAK